VKRVKVDFSTTVKDGLIRANQTRASEPMDVGDAVVAFDPAEDMEFEGVVDHLSGDGRFAFLRMEWEDDTPVLCNVAAGLNLSVTSLSAHAVTIEFPTLTVKFELKSSSEKGEGEYVSPPETSLEKGEGAYVSPPQAGPAQPLPAVQPISA
jgi:hypothetical protein